MNKKLSFLKYPGSKLRFVDLINKEISKIEEPLNFYIEPFLGSGATFLNLDRNFESYILSDFDRNIIKIWEIFNYEFLELRNFYEKEVLKYGNPGREKETYYKIRNELNEKYFNKNTKEESFYFYCVSRNVLNSMLRFGKKGINQSWGNRGYDLNLDQDSFDLIKQKLSISDILECDYKDILKEFYNDKDVLMFLDPPYEKTVIKTYKGIKDGDEKCFDKKEFLSLIKDIKSKIIYTDTYEKEVEEFLGFRVVKIRDMVNIQPRSKKNGRGNITAQEVMYCNF